MQMDGMTVLAGVGAIVLQGLSLWFIYRAWKKLQALSLLPQGVPLSERARGVVAGGGDAGLRVNTLWQGMCVATIAPCASSLSPAFS
ncbi:hypothetical protein D9M68_469680 [compost metagenome]